MNVVNPKLSLYHRPSPLSEYDGDYDAVASYSASSPNVAEITTLADETTYPVGALAADGYRLRCEPDVDRDAIENINRVVENKSLILG